jgi:DNA-directed RNA polymerase specialized sigma24 family protein
LVIFVEPSKRPDYHRKRDFSLSMPMFGIPALIDSSGSISRWLVDRTSSTQSATATLLWHHFGPRLVRIARQQLRAIRDPGYGSEDLALSTFQDFHRRILEGGYPNLADRDQVWRLLFTISLNKARNFRRAMLRRKRYRVGLSHVPEHRFSGKRSRDDWDSPSAVVAVVEECQSLLQLLDANDSSGRLRTIAMMRFEGASKSQIAKKLGSTRRTIDARIQWIQAIWNSHLRKRLRGNDLSR